MGPEDERSQSYPPWANSPPDSCLFVPPAPTGNTPPVLGFFVSPCPPWKSGFAGPPLGGGPAAPSRKRPSPNPTAAPEFRRQTNSGPGTRKGNKRSGKDRYPAWEGSKSFVPLPRHEFATVWSPRSSASQTKGADPLPQGPPPAPFQNPVFCLAQKLGFASSPLAPTKSFTNKSPATPRCFAPPHSQGGSCLFSGGAPRHKFF